MSATVGMSKNFSANQVKTVFLLLKVMQFGKVYTKLLGKCCSTISGRKCILKMLLFTIQESRKVGNWEKKYFET